MFHVKCLFYQVYRSLLKLRGTSQIQDGMVSSFLKYSNQRGRTYKYSNTVHIPYTQVYIYE